MITCAYGLPCHRNIGTLEQMFSVQSKQDTYIIIPTWQSEHLVAKDNYKKYGEKGGGGELKKNDKKAQDLYKQFIRQHCCF